MNYKVIENYISQFYNSFLLTTRNELYCSQQYPDKFKLYRLYDFEAEGRKENVRFLKGDLSVICTQPVNYNIALINKTC